MKFRIESAGYATEELLINNFERLKQLVKDIYGDDIIINSDFDTIKIYDDYRE